MFNTVAALQKTLSAGTSLNAVAKRLLSASPSSKMPIKVRH